jgi:hypothetical protein
MVSLLSLLSAEALFSYGYYSTKNAECQNGFLFCGETIRKLFDRQDRAKIRDEFCASDKAE